MWLLQLNWLHTMTPVRKPAISATQNVTSEPSWRGQEVGKVSHTSSSCRYTQTLHVDLKQHCKHFIYLKIMYFVNIHEFLK